MITVPARSSVARRHRTRRPVQANAVAFTLAAAVALSCAVIGIPAAGAAPVSMAIPNTDPYVPPSQTVVPPNTADCKQRSRPPAAVDTSEDLPPGVPVVAALPAPAEAVGGGRLGECGIIVPTGTPPLPPDISAGAWLIADLDTGEVLGGKDPHGRYRPASTLKLLTAQVMLKNLRDLKKVVEGTTADTAQDGTRVGIEAGGKYTVRQLLTYLIIISGNDAANALARANGGYDKTIADMNATARNLGALDTRAATVSGLDGPGQSTSAYDLALFAKADMATPPFPELISSVDIRVPSSGGQGYIAANDNQLLYQYKGALGGKTGFTDDAGNTYVGMAQRNGRRLVVTMLNGTQQPRRQWMQAASVLDWGFALPADTKPVGRLVDSLAEATVAVTAPTQSTGTPAPTKSSPAHLPPQIYKRMGRPMSTGTKIALVLAGVGIIVVLVGVVLLWRRRRSRQPAFAGDAATSNSSIPPADPPQPVDPETNDTETNHAETGNDPPTQPPPAQPPPADPQP